jgi:alanine racemase
MSKKPLSYIEISRKNLIHNVDQFKGLLKKGTQISAVVKANAYGHGDVEVVKTLSSKVDYFQVNSIEELIRIKKFTKKPILVFGYIGRDDLEKAIKLGCILSVFDYKHLILINKVSKKLNKKQKVHIAVDSYLGREGIMPVDVEKFAKEVIKMKNIIVDGTYSHFANIEDTADFSHAQKQIDAYEKTIEVFRRYGLDKIKTHISATSGVMVYEKEKGENNIVRIGIGLYGMWPSEYLKNTLVDKITLKPVLNWKTHIAQIKILPSGHSVGYGLSYVTSKETKIAVIPHGYADGLSRGLSNKGKVLIQGTKCPILGRVAMNMFVVDVSFLGRVSEGEEVVILGKQGNEEITAEDLAQKLDTINYEITTRINPLLPKMVVK